MVSATQLRLMLRDYILTVGVQIVYSNACFPMSIVVHDKGLRSLKSLDHLECFIKSNDFLQYWITELELPSVANALL